MFRFFFCLGTQLRQDLSCLVTKEDKKQKEHCFESVRTVFPLHSLVLFSQTLLTTCDVSSGQYRRTIAAATPTQTYQNICSGLLRSQRPMPLKRGGPRDVGWKEEGGGAVRSLKRQVGCICARLNSGTVCDWRQARLRHYSWRRDTVRLILLLCCNNKPNSPQCSRTDRRTEQASEKAKLFFKVNTRCAGNRLTW